MPFLSSTLRPLLIAALSVTVAEAQSVPCNCPWREYPAKPTAEVRRLFEAAERADTTVFLAALRAVAHPDSFAVDETPLVSAILWAKQWPADAPDARSRTYSTVKRAALDSLRAAHRASWPARERMLQAALARGVDPNGFTIHGMPPLLLAAVMGSPAMVDRLLRAGANPNVEASLRDDVNAIEYALEHEFPFRMLAFPEFVTNEERTTIIRRLLRAGTKAPWAGARFRMPAHSPWALVAALTEGDSIATELIAAGLTATQLDVDGIPPITAAAQFGNLAVVRVLRDLGPRTARIDGDSVVWSRTAPSDTAEIDLWLDAVNASASIDTTGQIAALLLQRGMPWSRPGPMGVVDNVPQHHLGVYGARDEGDVSVAAAATAPSVASSAPIGRNSGALPIVHAAAEANNVALLRRLQALGAPMDDTVQYRGTPLATAVRAASRDAVDWLLQQGSNPLRGGERGSAIGVALEAMPREAEGNAAPPASMIARSLLRGLTREQLTTSGDLSWLTGAIARRMQPAVPELEALVARGWTPTGLTATLLSVAIVDRDSAMVEWLLAQRVPLSPELDAVGRPVSLIASPLMLAVQSDNPPLVQRLLRAGASIESAGRSEGLTPLGVAFRMRSDALVPVLRDAGDSIERIPSPLLVGLAIETERADLRSALATRRDLPSNTVPDWSALGRRLLRDSTLFASVVPGLVRPTATLLRYSSSFEEEDSTGGSMVELMLKAAVDAMQAPSDARALDALLSSRLMTLRRQGALPVLLARMNESSRNSEFSAPVLAMVIGLRASTLTMLGTSTAPLDRRQGGLLLGVALCRKDVQVAAAARARGARPLPAAEQRDLCARIAEPR